MTVSQQTITIEGRQAKYWSGGSGKPLVLIHGGLGDAYQQWHTCFEALEPHFQIIAPDLPGFGVSAPLPMPSYQNYLNWLQLLLDMLNIGGPLLLMGNSFGAVLGRFFAAENTGYVSRLVLIDGGAIVDMAGCLRPLYRLPISSNIIFGLMHRQTYSHNGLKRVIYDEKQITPEFTTVNRSCWFFTNSALNSSEKGSILSSGERSSAPMGQERRWQAPLSLVA